MGYDEAACRHPKDYCKFRTSCLIYFIGREQALESPAAELRRQEENRKEQGT